MVAFAESGEEIVENDEAECALTVEEAVEVTAGCPKPNHMRNGRNSCRRRRRISVRIRQMMGSGMLCCSQVPTSSRLLKLRHHM